MQKERGKDMKAAHHEIHFLSPKSQQKITLRAVVRKPNVITYHTKYFQDLAQKGRIILTTFHIFYE